MGGFNAGCRKRETPVLVRLAGHFRAGKRAKWRSMRLFGGDLHHKILAFVPEVSLVPITVQLAKQKLL